MSNTPAPGLAVHFSKKPVSGPFADLWRDGTDYRIRLNDAGKSAITEFLSKYPKPITILKHSLHSLYVVARDVGIDEDEIEALCLYGVARGFARYQPNRGAQPITAATWGIRAAVSDAIRRRKGSPNFVVSEPLMLESVSDHRGEQERRFEQDVEAVEDCLACPALTSQERRVLECRYGVGRQKHALSANDAAKKLKICRTFVYRMSRVAIDKIRQFKGY